MITKNTHIRQINVLQIDILVSSKCLCYDSYDSALLSEAKRASCSRSETRVAKKGHRPPETGLG